MTLRKAARWRLKGLKGLKGVSSYPWKAHALFSGANPKLGSVPSVPSGRSEQRRALDAHRRASRSEHNPLTVHFLGEGPSRRESRTPRGHTAGKPQGKGE